MFEEFEFLKDADLSNFSTMKTGGKARYIVFPKNVKELIKILRIIKKNKLKFYVIGNGSNILFRDEGYDGVLISLKHFNKIEIDDVYANVGAGTNLFYLNQFLQKNGLSGLEWSYGIPATLGGLIANNGGCFGHEICEFVEEVIVLQKMKAFVLSKDEIDFSYRFSSLKDNFIILCAKLKLKKEDPEIIKNNMINFLEKKRKLQPCEFPSLGSIFKRRIVGEEILYPAKLIDNLGLKGVKIGGAEISTKHAGFIINVGGAKSQDVVDLIEFIEKKLAEIGVNTEKEIIIL